MDRRAFQERKQRHVEERWSRPQRLCAACIRNPAVEFLIASLVMFSFVLMVLEADNAPDVPSWVDATNILLLSIYIVEIAVRVFIFRAAFFWNFINVFDLFIIVIDTLAMALGALFEDQKDQMPSFAALRVCRMLRLARGFKLIVKFPQLTLIVKGLMRGVSAAFYGVGLLLMILTIWSVCAVQFIQPVNARVALTGIYENCERCPIAFDNVRNSMLTFIQQIIAGDSWGKVTIPIIEEAPETSIFFGLVFISIHVTIMNVILAVIVDTALKASEEEKQEEEYQMAQTSLLEICKEMDVDGSGDLTEEEILGGFDANEDFRDLLLSMDIKRENMHMIFNILDQDMSGTVNYAEFITELFKMRHDSHSMLVFIKHYITDIRRDVREQLRATKLDIVRIMQELGHDASVDQRNNLMFCATKGDFDAGGFEGIEPPENLLLDEKEPEPQEDRALYARKSGSYKTRRAPFRFDGEAPVGAASLKELGEELRHLRKVISDELLLSMKEMTQKANATVPFAAMPFPGGLGSTQIGHPLAGRDLVLGVGGQADSQGGFGFSPGVALPRRLPDAAAQRPASAWSLKGCCTLETALDARDAVSKP